MCDICVMNKVKERMLSRRGFFKAGSGAAVAATATAAGVMTPMPARAQDPAFMVDMTHTLDENFPTYFGTPGISREQTAAFDTDGFNLFNFTVMEHTGTHIDAPLHFSANGHAVDEIPVQNLICPLVVIDIAERAAVDPDTQVTPDDINAWIATNGPIPSGACVAMHSGWAEKVGSDGFRNADGDGVMHFPGFHVETAQMLRSEALVNAIAVDTLSLDHGPSADFATHYEWLPSNRYGIECIAGLRVLPAAGATLIVGAPKMGGGTGGPARILATI